MLCNGNTSEYCGGPNRLEMYQLVAITSVTSSTTTSSSTTTTTVVPTTISTTTTTTSPTTTSKPTTSTSTTTTSTTSSTTTSTTVITSTTSTTTTPKFTSAATGLPTGWSYQGCWVDNANGRILINQQPDSATLTDESCVSTCIGLGYSVAGMEYSTQCFCGNTIIQGGTLANADTECNMACSGNAAEMCGAGNRMSIYSKGPLTVLQPAAVQTTGLPGSWTYQGCIT